MNINISEEFKAICPKIELGVVVCDVVVNESSQELKSALNSTYNKCRDNLNREDIAKQANIISVRRFYKQCGKDPARYRPASEALIRRAVQDKGLDSINNIVDVNNIISMQSHYPICAYNYDEIKGDILFRKGVKNDPYGCIGGYDMNVENMPVFSDDLSAFGSPTRDSLRTMTRESMNKLIYIIISFGGDRKLQEFLEKSVSLLQSFADATDVKVSIVK